MRARPTPTAPVPVRRLLLMSERDMRQPSSACRNGERAAVVPDCARNARIGSRDHDDVGRALRVKVPRHGEVVADGDVGTNGRANGDRAGGRIFGDSLKTVLRANGAGECRVCHVNLLSWQVSARVAVRDVLSYKGSGKKERGDRSRPSPVTQRYWADQSAPGDANTQRGSENPKL